MLFLWLAGHQWLMLPHAVRPSVLRVVHIPTLWPEPGVPVLRRLSGRGGHQRPHGGLGAGTLQADDVPGKRL